MLGTLQSSTARPRPVAPAATDARSLSGLRVAVVAGEPLATAAVVRALRGHGSIVAVVDGRGRGLAQARELDPEVLLVDPTALAGVGHDLARRLHDDARLRWASVVRVRYEHLGADPAAEVAALVAPLVAPDRLLREHARAGRSFACELPRLGPNRALRALEGTDVPLCVGATSAGAVAEVVVVGELVVHASWWESGPASVRLSGTDALTAFLTMRRGRLEVRRCVAMVGANVLSPIPEALALASGQVAEPVRPARRAAPPPVPVDDPADEATTQRRVAVRPAPARLHPADPPAAAPDVSKGTVPFETSGQVGGETWRREPPWIGMAAGVLVLAAGVAIAMQPTRYVDAAASEADVVEVAPAPKPEPEVAPEPEPEPVVATEPDPVPEDSRAAARELVERARGLGTTPEAEQLYLRALELFEHSPRAMAGLAEIHLGRGEETEAIFWARRAVALSPRRASYRVLLGDALAAAGDRAAARRAWQEADRLAPGRPRILRRLR